MSKLNLNIPITIEPTAMIDIKEDSVTREVIDAYGNYSTFEETANSMDFYTGHTGLSLRPGEITFNTSYLYIKNPDGTQTKFFSDDQNSYINTDMVEAINVSVTNSIQTDDDNCRVTIQNGIIKAESLVNGSYIELGVDNNSYMTLRYVNSQGREVYQLSPYTPFSSYLNINNN